MATDKSGNRPDNTPEPNDPDPGSPAPETPSGATASESGAANDATESTSRIDQPEPGAQGDTSDEWWRTPTGSATPTSGNAPTIRLGDPANPMPGAPDPFAQQASVGLPGSGESEPSGPPPATPPDLLSASGFDQGEQPRRMRGSMQRQEPGVTKPRPPTLAETRAREKARKRAEEAERAAAEALEEKRRKRKRMLIGGGAVAGVAALVGGGYLAYRAATAPPNVTATCITEDNGQQTVQPDDDCVKAQAAYGSGGAYYGGGPYLGPGIFFYNGHQYRYYYGGPTQTVGRPPVGGSTVEPKGAHVTTKSGTVVRGGLGTTSGGSKSGGS
ncbi:hypothetical protein ACWDSJ_37160 [Nocardia sp. NPDC003482]